MSIDGEKMESILATGLTEYSEYYIHEENLEEVKQICRSHSYEIEFERMSDKSNYLFIKVRKIR